MRTSTVVSINASVLSSSTAGVRKYQRSKSEIIARDIKRDDLREIKDYQSVICKLQDEPGDLNIRQMEYLTPDQDQWLYLRQIDLSMLQEIVRRFKSDDESENIDWFNSVIEEKSSGARYLAHRCRKEAGDIKDIQKSITQFKSDWAALKCIKHFLWYHFNHTELRQVLIDCDLITEIRGDYLGGGNYAPSKFTFDAHKLLNIGVRFERQLMPFVLAYAKYRTPNRVWGSSYQIDQKKIIKLIDAGCMKLPEWCVKFLVRNWIPINFDRIGNIWDLPSAVKGWKVCNSFPKKIAMRVGELPLWKRMVAKDVWNQLDPLNFFSSTTYSSENFSRTNLINEFWNQFNERCKIGAPTCIDSIVATDKLTIQRVVSMKMKGLLKYQRMLINEILVNYHQHLELDEQYQFKPGQILQGLKVGVYFDALDQHIWVNDITNNVEVWMDYRIDPTRNRADWYVKDEWIFKSFFNATLIFGKELPRWVEKQKSIGRGEHDALYWLPLVPASKCLGLSKWLFKFGERDIAQLEVVAKRWQYLTDEERKLPFKDLVAFAKSQKYAGVRDQSFALEAGTWGVSQSSYSNMESRWIATLDVPTPFDTKKSFSSSGLVGRFLPRNDARGLFLGQHTNCCQHPDGVGQACAWYGQENPNSQFFVIEDQQSNIIGMSWVWLSDDNGACFDNFESKGLGCREEAAQNILQQVADHLSHSHHIVTIGTGLGDINLSPWQEEATPALRLPSDYSGYTDARSQRVLKRSSSCVPVVRKQQEVWVRGATQDDLDDNIDLLKIARACYPKGWQFVGTQDTDMGFVLMHNFYCEIGYCAIELKNKYISDIAVHPAQRKHSMVLIRHLLKFIKSIGAEWTCDARESTSFKLLKLLERRGVVQINSQCQNIEIDMEGETMWTVKFEVK